MLIMWYNIYLMNRGNKMAVKQIILCTTNFKKIKEFEKIFSNYSISTLKSDDDFNSVIPENAESIIMKEQTTLFVKKSNEVINFEEIHKCKIKIMKQKNTFL